MTKRLVYIITILVALSIGTMHMFRISDTYFKEEVIEPEIVESVPPAYYMEYPAMMASPSENDSMRVYDDSLYTEEEALGVVETLDEGNSDGSGWIPSDRALETKFWLDSIGSFLTTVSPFVVPFIMFRKKKEEDKDTDN